MASSDPTTSGDPTLPSIDPTTFDLIIFGTSLSSSLIAAAAATNNHSVLHLDPTPFYGALTASIPPPSLLSFLASTPLFSHLASSPLPPLPGAFLLDVSSPRLLFCADPVVDVMVRCGASHHVDFRSLDGSVVFWEGAFWEVPDSREAVFRDKGLGLKEKGAMVRFLKLVKGFVEGEGGVGEEELEGVFVEFLEKQRLPKKIQAIILYAIAMADHDQENQEDANKLIETKEGLQRLALYSSSLGRFPNAVGAFIYPIYGQGELPQAFCRCAAVKGAIYVLRMPVEELLTNEEDGHCEGVKLGSGQSIYCKQLLVDPSFPIPSSVSSDLSKGGSEDINQMKNEDVSNISGKVARMVCVTSCSIRQDLLNILVIFPPKSLHAEQRSTVRVLQLGSNVVFCPSNMFVLYLSVVCNSASEGKEYLHAALNALLNSLGNSKSVSEGVPEAEPIVLWSASYVQELEQVSNDKFFSSPMPDSSIDYRNTLEATLQLFKTMYPTEEFLPERSTSENIEEDEE